MLNFLWGEAKSQRGEANYRYGNASLLQFKHWLYLKCNILSTFALKNYGKFRNHNLERLCSRFLALASTITVFDFKEVCPRKVGPLP